jgi:cell division septation protein DedD
MVRPLAFLLALSAVVSCTGAGAAPARGPRPLPADSAALLAEALRSVHPAFATQAEALAAGAYADVRPVLASPAASPPPQVAAAPHDAPASSTAARPYVIQLAAFRERTVADAMVVRVRQRFPQWSVVIEETSEVVRVALGEWTSAGSAENALSAIRAEYPDAWIRTRGSP